MRKLAGKINSKKPYLWIAEARRDVKHQKKRQKRRVGMLDFRSVAITLAFVGIIFLFQNIHKNEKEFKLSGLRHTYQDFEEIENRAINIAVILRFEVGNFDLDEEYNYGDDGIDLGFLYNFFLALGTKNPKKAKIALDHYDESIYGKMSSFGAINRRLAEQAKDINNAAKDINNSDALIIIENTAFIYSMFEAHYDKLQEVLNTQREMLKIIKESEADKRGGELSIAKEKIKQYYIDLEWQKEKINDAHNKINESFSSLEIGLK